ncbi:hypothetical protein A2974_03135 [Candidatus Peregrinibacteria bacterium RIFCSPLOWO2_01_FULL_48_20]|nr:MAG: hypothetical protein A2974_03135 [Candidatus Peregrinibacteria bacterium RIFCSPLOWO2_01_FULL_48_20]
MDDSFKKTAHELIQAVDAREKNKTDEDSYEDLSKQVEHTLYWQIQTIENRAKVIIRAFPEEGPDYVQVEKNLFDQELRTAQKKIERRFFVNQRLVNKLVEDILSNFGNEGESVQMEWEAFKQMIDQPPLEGDDLLGIDDPFKNPYEVLVIPYQFGLGEKPYGKKTMEYAYKKALENGDYHMLLGDEFFNKDLIEDFENMRDEAFRQALSDEDALSGLANIMAFQARQTSTTSSEVPQVKGALPRPKNGWVLYGSDMDISEIPESQFLSLCERAAGQDPSVFLQLHYLKYYKDIPGLRETVKTAFININLNYRTTYLHHLKPFLNEDEIRELTRDTLEELLESNHENVLFSYERYKDYIEAPETWVQRAIEKDPEMAILYYHETQDLPDAELWVKWAAKKLLKTNYRSALFLYNIYGSSYNHGSKPPFPEDYEESLIKEGLEKYPDFLLDFALCGYSIQKRQDWPEIKEKAEVKGVYFKAKREEAVEILLKSIPDIELNNSHGNPSRRRDQLLMDPAIVLYPLIELEWIPIKDKTIAVQTAILLLRNLLAQNLKPSQENVDRAYKQLQEVREKNKNIGIFYYSNVLMVSHSEVTKENKAAFGKPALQEAIKAKQGPNTQFESVKAEKNTLEELKKTKKRALDAIEDFPSPMTFIFDGHAWEHALFLSDGNIEGAMQNEKQTPLETETTIKITLTELANALAAREKKGKNPSGDILIINGCGNYLFAKNLYAELENRNVAKPIIITPSEYGQLMFYWWDHVYGDEFWTALLEPTHPSLGDFWPMNEIHRSNPSVFIPIEDVPLQFAGKDFTLSKTPSKPV